MPKQNVWKQLHYHIPCPRPIKAVDEEIRSLIAAHVGSAVRDVSNKLYYLTRERIARMRTKP